MCVSNTRFSLLAPLGIHGRQGIGTRVISNSIELSFETYRHSFQKGQRATKKNMVFKKAEVLRSKPSERVEGQTKVSGGCWGGAAEGCSEEANSDRYLACQ